MARWNAIAELVIRQCFRDVFESLGFKNLNAAAQKLAATHSQVSETSVREFVYNRKVDSEEEKQEIISCLAAMLRSNLSAVLGRYQDNTTQTIIQALLSGGLPQSSGEPWQSATEVESYANLVATEWVRSFATAPEVLESGVYQVVRRYKPFLPLKRTSVGYNLHDPLNHAIIAELLLIDAKTMECVLVTSQKNIYRGTITINHEHILYAVMTRVLIDSSQTNFRMMTIKIEDKSVSLYSGLMIKAGETSRQPISAECLLNRIPEDYAELLDAMKAIHSDRSCQTLADPTTIIRYLTDAPPNEPYIQASPGAKWKRVRFVRDIPELIPLVERDENQRSALREPSRALSMDSLLDISTSRSFPIIKWAE